MRAVVRYNPSLSGVIDLVDFAAERNGERDINPAKLAAYRFFVHLSVLPAQYSD